MADEPDHLFIRSLAELEAWLSKNHSQRKSVWFVYYKSSLKKSDVTYSGIVDTLLCFGWIDSLPRRVDEERTSIRISPRSPKSNWSKVNKDKVFQLTRKKRMQPSGLAMVQLAKLKGTWDALRDVDALLVPEDLNKALTEQDLRDVWDAMAPSWRRGCLEVLFNAKGPETRERRIRSISNELNKR